MGLFTLLDIYFMVFSHATGTVSLAYMMVDVWDCPSTCYLFYGFQPCYGDGVPGLHDGGCVGLLTLLVIYFMVFSHATGTVTAPSTCFLFYGFHPCYGDGVPGLHDGGCVGLLTLLVIYFMVHSHATGTVSLAYMMVGGCVRLLTLLVIYFIIFQPCYGDGVPGLHDGGCVGLIPTGLI